MGRMKELYTKMQEICEVCDGANDKPSLCHQCRMCIELDGKEVILVGKQITEVHDGQPELLR